jgi:hypothetical protein
LERRITKHTEIGKAQDWSALAPSILWNEKHRTDGLDGAHEKHRNQMREIDTIFSTG